MGMTFNENPMIYHSTPKIESIDTMDIDNILVDTENELENFKNDSYRKRLRLRNGKVIYKV